MLRTFALKSTAFTFYTTDGEFFAVFSLHANTNNFTIVHIDALDDAHLRTSQPLFLSSATIFLISVSMPTLEGEDPFTHEVGKDNAVSNSWVINVRSVGIGNWLHQKTVHIICALEKLFEHFTRSLRVIVVEVHLAQMRVESFHFLAVYLEVVDQNISEVFAIKGCPNIHLRVDEANVLELMN